MLDTTDSLLLVGAAVIMGPILLAAAMIYAINRRPTQLGEDNRNLSGAKADWRCCRYDRVRECHLSFRQQ
jgi:hypothetical protein